MNPARLLVVDATNMAVRCGFGGGIPAEPAARTALGMIERAAASVEADGLVLAFDSEGPTFRHELTAHLPEAERYKAGRTTDTRPYTEALLELATAHGWRCLHVQGYEGDDVAATTADRARRAGLAVYVLSGDSDTGAMVRGRPGEPKSTTWLRPVNGGGLDVLGDAEVAAKYGLAFACQLTDYKALVGEPGDNVAGVPGIGPKKAQALLAANVDLAAILNDAKRGTPGLVATVAVHRERALLARQLVALRTDVPLPALSLGACRVRAVQPVRAAEVAA